VWIEVDVPEAAADRVRKAAGDVRLSVGTDPADTIAARFVRAGQIVSAETRTVPFYFQAANPRDRLVFGMTVSARLDPAAAPVAAPAAAPVPRTIRAVGTVRADPRREAEVVAPIWGRIDWAARPLAVGDRVKKDEELLRLLLELPIAERYAMNTRLLELRAAVDVAKKRAEQSDADYQRAVGLMRSNPGEPLYQTQAEWAERLLGAAREAQELMVRQTTVFEGVMKRRDPKITPVTAPIAGTVVEIAFTPGGLDLTQEFRKLLTIADLSHVWLAAEVFERDLDAIRRARRGTFTTAAGVTRPLGPAIAISPFVDDKKRTVQVLFQVANPNGALSLGGFVTLSFDVE
jgi:cobalt-zinc-cadmium efflux system membrane fusion protein